MLKQKRKRGSDKTFNSKDSTRFKKGILPAAFLQFGVDRNLILTYCIPNKLEEEPRTESWWNQEEPVGQLSCGQSIMF